MYKNWNGDKLACQLVQLVVIAERMLLQCYFIFVECSILQIIGYLECEEIFEIQTIDSVSDDAESEI